MQLWKVTERRLNDAALCTRARRVADDLVGSSARRRPSRAAGNAKSRLGFVGRMMSAKPSAGVEGGSEVAASVIGTASRYTCMPKLRFPPDL